MLEEILNAAGTDIGYNNFLGMALHTLIYSSGTLVKICRQGISIFIVVVILK